MAPTPLPEPEPEHESRPAYRRLTDGPPHLVVAELARALPAAESARVAESITRRVDRLLAEQPLHDCVDVPVAADLVAILGALRRQ